MRTEAVEFRSDGTILRGFYKTPDVAEDRLPTVIHGPGWLNLASAEGYLRWHDALCSAGYAVLTFDYRGFGGSDGERGWMRPTWQVEDILNAFAYLLTRDDVDPARIGIFGMGGTGGGNAIVAAAEEAGIRTVVSLLTIADGADWFRGMRTPAEWDEFVTRVMRDRMEWVAQGHGEQVHPRKELMVETQERIALNPKRDVDAVIGDRYWLRSAEYIMRFRPIDHVHRIAPRPLLIIAVEGDDVTPETHAVALYKAAGDPKKLVTLTGTTHYRALRERFDDCVTEVVQWFDQYLLPAPR